MANTSIKRVSPRSKDVGEITSVEVLTESFQDTQDLSKLTKHFRHRNSWVVYPLGDSPSHYASLVANLTGHVSRPTEPTFQFLRSTIKHGLPKSAFNRIKNAIAITTEELSRIADIPSRTVSRRERFKPDESERLLRVASAFQRAIELFEDLEKARKWFTTPKRALGDLTPMECCDTETGASEVENLLGRIDESVYS